ncbi:MAG TPA: hypothetical protein VFE58_02555 [Tepidisphaeraceae bacterium]|jgi:hypothetical protein|nr:hypothetical protein [Tepidisphaeraceae bacterium]
MSKAVTLKSIRQMFVQMDDDAHDILAKKVDQKKSSTAAHSSDAEIMSSPASKAQPKRTAAATMTCKHK